MLEQAYQLVIRKGPQPGQIIPLTAPTITLGRDPSAGIVVDDAEVSRLHARLVLTEDGYRLEDLGSTNGTFVDGRNISAGPILLEPDQAVQLGSSVILIYQLADAAEDVQANETEAETPAGEAPAGEKANKPLPATEPLPTAEPAPEIEPIDPMLPPSFDDLSEPEQLPTLRQLHETSDASSPDDEAELPDLPEIPSLPELSELPELAAEPPMKSRPHVVAAAEPIAPSPARGSSNKRIAGILVAVLLILVCCCCGFLFFMYQWGGDWLLRQMQLLP